MKAIKKIFAMVVLAFAVGCTGVSTQTVICDAAKATSSVVAVGISTGLACTNVQAITTTLQAKLQSTNICQASNSSAAKLSEKSVLGDVICPTVINSVFEGGIQSLPKEWGCTGTGSVETLKAQLIASCEKSL